MKKTTKEVLRINTENLKRFMVMELKKACPNVAYLRATDKTPFPYVVFDLEHKKQEAGYLTFIEINIFDNSKSSKIVESIADGIEDILDDTMFDEETFTISIDLNARNNVDESDKGIQRRRLLFDAEYYD